MANYGGNGSSLLDNVYVSGAVTAPRIHGHNTARYTIQPRIKNQYIVSFHYSNLTTTAGGVELRNITHRVKSVDLPKMEIKSEIHNSYNKPRIIPTNIEYSPISIQFWDDRADIVQNFWTGMYEFYFKNGRNKNENNYATTVPDSIVNKLGTVNYKGYEHFGYNMGNKINNKNLFQYMSIYLLGAARYSRIDLVNPFVESMGHDQYNQEMGNELAVINTTWVFEDVIYYEQADIASSTVLKGLMPEHLFPQDTTAVDSVVPTTDKKAKRPETPMDANEFAGTIAQNVGRSVNRGEYPSPPDKVQLITQPDNITGKEVIVGPNDNYGPDEDIYTSDIHNVDPKLQARIAREKAYIAAQIQNADVKRADSQEAKKLGKGVVEKPLTKEQYMASVEAIRQENEQWMSADGDNID